MKKKILYTILIFIVIALVGVLYVPFQNSSEDIFSPISVSQNATNTPLEAPASQRATPAPSTLVHIVVHGRSYDETFTLGQTAYDAMQKLASTTSTFSFKADYYASLGFFIKEINGIKNAGGSYWTFYINDAYSSVGASSYVLKDGDRIEWRFEKK